MDVVENTGDGRQEHCLNGRSAIPYFSGLNGP